MEILLQTLAATLISISTMLGIGYEDTLPILSPDSVELGLREVSPQGTAGGFAIPASGCSVPHAGGYYQDCEAQKPDISVNKPIVRLGEPLTVSWNPKLNIGCVLSSNAMLLTTSPNPAIAPNANVTGSRIAVPAGETTYTITCTGAGNSDTVTAKILPRYQET